MTPGALIATKYRLTRKLGEGAMGVVWAAVNETTGREVALKLIHNPSAELRSRLLREARACGRLVHRHIVEVYDVGETEQGDPFLVMQMLSGETLDDRLVRVRRLAATEAVSVAVAVARALRTAHAAGIVHRDLKPANIFLHREPDTPDEIVKVLDFGVSKTLRADEAGSTTTGSLLGSPAYMSPEQAQGSRDVDYRSDLWSFGVVLFEMLTGRRPFPSNAVYAVIAEVLSAPIPSVASLLPAADPALSRVVARCLERDVARRVASADDLIQMLIPFSGDLTSSRDGAPSPFSARAPLPSRSGRTDESTELMALDAVRRDPPPSVPRVGADDEDYLPTNVLDLKQVRVVEATVALLQPAPRAAPERQYLLPPEPRPLPAPPAPNPPPSRPDAAVPAPLAAAVDDEQRRTEPMVPRAPAPAPSTASSSTTPLMHAQRPAPPRDARRRALVVLGIVAAATLLVLIGVGLGGALSSPPSAPASPSATAPPPATPAPVPAPSTPPSAPSPEDEPAPAGSTPGAPSGGASAASPERAAAGTPMGTLNINSIPICNAIVDGKPVGPTPKLGLRLPVGVHHVTFVHPQLGRQEVIVPIKAGETRTAAVKFDGKQTATSVQSPGF